MVELSANFEMDASVVMAAPLEEVEQMLKDTVAGNLTTQISSKLEEMSFMDMRLDEESNKFIVEAELVLCSKQSVITNIEMMSKKMKTYGLMEEDIIDILSTMVQDTEGF